MKKGGNLKSRQLNNKGMSLVEVLIAIMILAVVTGPILKTFVTATRFNAKSKEQQRVTTVAQSIMEGFKAYDIEELCEQFNGTATFQVIANASGGVSEVNPGDGDDNYTFRLEDVSFEGKYFYDAEVQVTPRVPGVPDASVTYDGIESDMLVSVDNMNAYKDAVYKQDVLQDEKAYDSILKDFLDNELQPRDKMYLYELAHIDRSKISVKKYTTVTITGSDSTSYQVQVQTEYKYSVTDYPYYDESGNELHFDITDKSCASSTTMIYDSTETASAGAKLENVYIYYYPAYNTSLAPVKLAEDNITITNSADTKNVYLIKQKFPESKISNTSLMTCESSYTPTVVAGDRVQLYHNLDKNLASEGSSVGAVSLSAVLTPKTEFVTTESKVLLFNVTVSIFNPADNFTGTPLLTLDGTMNDQ